ncbi:hypothetical protein EX895_005153 [Sporisorium graminicola]|uniref:Zn(2)-C6 fungal-type domain-containing protein n=1 Tax=Sporisorium graminicola TaxID=280036 RepID=A0A4U7KST4_9BASI|nr:hypothetical protein EX895_005153 [Sporisorium graminicola]TKY86328.1 hypothetical protein EX895_005153 [Sporisorium graminicola]
MPPPPLHESSTTTMTTTARKRRKTTSARSSYASSSSLSSIESRHSGSVVSPKVNGTATVPAAAAAAAPSASKPNHDPHQPPPGRELKSCTECGRRKIRCDKQRPCTACTNRGEPELCYSGTYTRLRTDRKSYATVEQFDQLKQKLNQLESALAHRLYPYRNAPHMPFPSSSLSAQPPPLHATSHLSLLSDLCAASASAPSSSSTFTAPPSPRPPRPAHTPNVARDPALATGPTHKAATAQAEQHSALLGQLSSSIRRIALDHSSWAETSFVAEDASTGSLHAAFLARLLVLFPRRHIANALIDAFFSLPNVVLNHVIDPAELHTAVDGLYDDLLQRRRPRTPPAFIALLMAVFAAGLHAADPDVPEQRTALEACGWVAHTHHPSAATASLLNLSQSFFNVRVAGLTGFAHGDGPGGQVRLTIPFTVRAWHESCLKALHLADFLAQPSFPALAALEVMGCICLEPTQAARRDSLAAIAFAMARRLKLHRSSSSNKDHRSRHRTRLICVMALHECQAALAHPDRNGFVAWPHNINHQDAAAESYDAIMARLVTLSQHVCQTVFQHSNAGQQTDTLPVSVATRLCGEMDTYYQRLPRGYMQAEMHAEPRSANPRASASRSSSVATGVGDAGVQQLDRSLVHIHLAALRVLVLTRIPSVQRSNSRTGSGSSSYAVHDALRSELHTIALRHLTLSAKVCTVWPAFLKFSNNGLLVVRSALAVVLHLQMGWIETALRQRVAAALGWVCDQLHALKAHGAQVGKLKWLIEEVLRRGPHLHSNGEVVPAQDRLDQLLSQLVASTATPDAAERPVWSNFVGPETLDTVASVANYSNNGDHRAQEAFHVLRIEPDCTVMLQDSTQPAENQSDSVHAQHQEMDASPQPQQEQQQEQQKTLPPSEVSLFAAHPPTPRLSMVAEVSPSSYHDMVGSQPMQIPGFGDPVAQDTDVPQWVSSLLEAVLNGVA